MLRPGDVVTHAFHGRAEGLIDDAGRVKPGITEAQRRGVVFRRWPRRRQLRLRHGREGARGWLPARQHQQRPARLQRRGPGPRPGFGAVQVHAPRAIPRRGGRAQHAVDREGPGRGRNAGDAAPGRRRGPHPHALEEAISTFKDALGVSVQGRERLAHVMTVKDGRVYRPGFDRPAARSIRPEEDLTWPKSVSASWAPDTAALSSRPE